MADLTTQYNRIVNAKASLKTSINAKGGTLTTETIDQYASAVDNLPSGGGITPTTNASAMLYEFDYAGWIDISGYTIEARMQLNDSSYIDATLLSVSGNQHLFVFENIPNGTVGVALEVRSDTYIRIDSGYGRTEVYNITVSLNEQTISANTFTQIATFTRTFSSGGRYSLYTYFERD